MVKLGPKTEQPLSPKSRKDPLLENHSKLLRKTTAPLPTCKNTTSDLLRLLIYFCRSISMLTLKPQILILADESVEDSIVHSDSRSLATLLLIRDIQVSIEQPGDRHSAIVPK